MNRLFSPWRIVSAALLAISAVILFHSAAFAEDAVDEPPPAETESAPPAEAEPAVGAESESSEAPPADTNPVVLDNSELGAASETPPTESMAEPATAAGSEDDSPVETLSAETGAQESAPVIETPSQAPFEEAQAVENTEIAAQASADGDPWWKAGSKTYRVLRAGGCPAAELNVTCFENPSPITYAITLIDNGNAPAPSDGILHVESALSAFTENIVLDGSDAELAKIKSIVGEKTDPADSFPTLNGYVYVHNYLTAFTFSGFIVDGSNAGTGLVRFENNNGALTLKDLEVTNSGVNGHGVFVTQHTGAVTLTNVQANDNNGVGIYVDNSTGTGNINLTHCAANRNGADTDSDGMTIVSRGVVNLISVSSNSNTVYGAYINAKSLIAKSGAFNNNGDSGGYGLYFTTYDPGSGSLRGSALLENVTASGNVDDGIYLFVNGSINLNAVNASHNQKNGATLNNCYRSGSTCLFPGATVSVRNSRFTDNAQTGGNYGLSILSNGAITLSDMWADANGDEGTAQTGQGAYISTEYASNAPINITASHFNGNYGNGATLSASGTVTLRDLEASSNLNSGYGLKVNSTYGNGSVTLSSSSGVWNRFNSNTDSDFAVQIYSLGNVTLNNVEASYNSAASNALDVSNGGAITLNGGSFYQNGNTAARLQCNGAINVKLIDQIILGHAQYGLILSNSGDATPANITLEGGYFVSNGTGISINSNGNVVVRNVVASNRTNYGLLLINNAGIGSVRVECTRKDFSCSFYRSTNNSGIRIVSNGSVTLSKLTASENGATGIMVDNYNSGNGTGSITLNTITANDNQTSGIALSSKGSVTLTAVIAKNNGEFGVSSGDGVNIDNSYATLAGKGVTVSNSTFQNNNGDGLEVTSNGAINVSKLTVTDNYNGIAGITLINNDGLPVSGKYPSVTVSNCRTTVNQVIGLYVNSRGVISVSNVEASANSSYGMQLDNTAAVTTTPGVTVTGSSSTRTMVGGNALNLYIRSHGVVTVSNLSVLQSSSGNGADIDNRGVNTSPLGVTISNCNFTYNTSYGLLAISYGAITLRSVEALDNGSYGVNLNNSSAATNVGVTITGKSGRSSLSYNGSTGLNVSTRGKVTVSNILTVNNENGGIILNNNSSPDQQNTSLTNIYSAFNSGGSGYGIRLNVKGNLTLSGIYALNNTNNGVQINSSAGNVTLSGSSNIASGNGVSGFTVSSVGAVNLSKLTAENNTNYGVYVDNHSAAGGAGTVTLNTVRGCYNGTHGVYLYNSGLAQLKYITTLGNGLTSDGNGIYVADSGYNIFITYSTTHGNGGYGIRVVTGTLMFPLTGVTYYGNDIDGDQGEITY